MSRGGVWRLKLSKKTHYLVSQVFGVGQKTTYFGVTQNGRLQYDSDVIDEGGLALFEGRSKQCVCDRLLLSEPDEFVQEHLRWVRRNE